MPAAGASTGRANLTGAPASRISPPDGGKLPATILSRVDLPAPLSPIRPRTSPASMAASTPASASIAPKCLEMPRSSRNAMACRPPRARRWRASAALEQRLLQSGRRLHEEHQHGAAARRGRGMTAALGADHEVAGGALALVVE